MRKLNTKEVNEALQTVKVFEIKGKTFYVDKLKTGEFGVSRDEFPLVAVDSFKDAEDYVFDL